MTVVAVLKALQGQRPRLVEIQPLLTPRAHPIALHLTNLQLTQRQPRLVRL